MLEVRRKYCRPEAKLLMSLLIARSLLSSCAVFSSRYVLGNHCQGRRAARKNFVCPNVALHSTLLYSTLSPASSPRSEPPSPEARHVTRAHCYSCSNTVFVWSRHKSCQSMVLHEFFFYTAFLTTSLVHMYWNQMVTASLTLIVSCLSNPGSPILFSMFRLHCLVLCFFLVAACFRLTTAGPVP